MFTHEQNFETDHMGKKEEENDFQFDSQMLNIALELTHPHAQSAWKYREKSVQTAKLTTHFNYL